MTCEIDDVNLVFYGIAIMLAMAFLFIAMRATPVPPLLAPGQTPTPAPQPKPSREVLTQLINAGATFYGASWCGFTKKQLSELGITETETHGLDYVSCEENEQLCSEKGIEAFPTWQINGQTYPGYYSPDKLLDLLRKHK
tara:strand:+ start:25 stop:444 length:420 start_codon:yes stop_codon:yes gene_type:complete